MILSQYTQVPYIQSDLGTVWPQSNSVIPQTQFNLFALGVSPFLQEVHQGGQSMPTTQHQLQFGTILQSVQTPCLQNIPGPVEFIWHVVPDFPHQQMSCQTFRPFVHSVHCTLELLVVKQLLQCAIVELQKQQVSILIVCYEQIK